MVDDLSSKTEKFLHRWVPLTNEPGATTQAQGETSEQIQNRFELFMKKVEGQAQVELAKPKQKASPFDRIYWQFAFARLQHPVAVTAMIISICAALFVTVTKQNRRELRQSVTVSFPADETLKQAESTIELLRTSYLELGDNADPPRVARLNALIRQKYPAEEKLAPSTRAQLAQLVMVYNDSLAQWKKRNNGPQVVRNEVAQKISPIKTDDSERMAQIYRVVEQDSPANAEILKNASIVGIEANRVVWEVPTEAQSWNETSFQNSKKKISTDLLVRDPQGLPLKVTNPAD